MSRKSSFSLRTPRLELVPARLDLLDQQWEAVMGSVNELRVWMPWALKPEKEETRTYFERAENHWKDGDDRPFVVMHGGRAAGACSLDRVDPLNLNTEIGYWLRSDLCGRGLMTEAASAVISYGFDELKMHRIELRAGTGNAPSIRVAEKLGFTREGVLREAGQGAGGFHDLYVYSLLETQARPTFHLKSGVSTERG